MWWLMTTFCGLFEEFHFGGSTFESVFSFLYSNLATLQAEAKLEKNTEGNHNQWKLLPS